jgi:hypothetical protein
MIDLRRFNESGINLFSEWLEHGNEQTLPPELLNNPNYSEAAYDVQISPDEIFESRYEFGKYLNERLVAQDFNELMAAENDNLWAWLAAVYFKQLSGKGKRRKEHYIVIRKGSLGSLAYRHAVRTSFELVHIHGQNALVCLSVGMHTFGDMTEQLASRQTLAHNRGFFQTAYKLYFRDGKLRKGARSKPKNLRNRRPGDKTGIGGARRLATALQRLDLTYDTELMDGTGIIAVLPKEFNRWDRSEGLEKPTD